MRTTNGTILITGALGYIGGRLATALCAEGSWRLRLGTHSQAQKRPSWLPAGEMLRLDVVHDRDLRDACSGVDTIIHLAALNEIDSALDPQKAVEVNTVGTLRLLQAAIKSGVRRFLYFSTAHVYGAPLAGTIDESTLPKPVHPYAISHYGAEQFVLAAHAGGKIAGLVLRLSNGFGFPAHLHVNRWSLVSNDLCRQAVLEKKLVLQSSGMQRRDFIPLSDVVQAVAHFLALPAADWNDGLFNVGGGCSVRILDLAQRIAARCADQLGFTPPIERPPAAPGENGLPLTYSIEKLLATGFRLRGSVDDEIDGTLRLCAANRDALLGIGR